MRASTIYFIQAGDAGPIKIGFTSGCPLDRMANLQTGSPDELRLVAHARGTQEDERELHKRFAHLRMRGEWFQPKSELVEFIRGIQFAQRDEPPLQQAPQLMIGDLGREDLERVFAYVHVRMVEERAKNALELADLESAEYALLDLRAAFQDLLNANYSADLAIHDAVTIRGRDSFATLIKSVGETLGQGSRDSADARVAQAVQEGDDPTDSFLDDSHVDDTPPEVH